jgi:hypothetical protein
VLCRPFPKSIEVERKRKGLCNVAFYKVLRSWIKT